MNFFESHSSECWPGTLNVPSFIPSGVLIQHAHPGENRLARIR